MNETKKLIDTISQNGAYVVDATISRGAFDNIRHIDLSGKTLPDGNYTQVRLDVFIPIKDLP